MIDYLYTVYFNNRKIGVFGGSTKSFLKILGSINLKLNNISHIYLGQKLYGTDVFDKILEKKGTEAPSNSANFQDERGVFLIHNQFIDPKDKLVPTAFIDDEL